MLPLTIKTLIKQALNHNPSATNKEITNYVGKHRNIKYSHLLPGSLIKEIRNNSYTTESYTITNKSIKSSLEKAAANFMKEHELFLIAQKQYESAKQKFLNNL